jgi:hypothetical protein
MRIKTVSPQALGVNRGTLLLLVPTLELDSVEAVVEDPRGIQRA